MNISYIIGLIVLVVLLFIIGPLLAIWSLNTLFPNLMIPLTWQTWLATAILIGIVKGRRYKE